MLSMSVVKAPVNQRQAKLCSSSSNGGNTGCGSLLAPPRLLCCGVELKHQALQCHKDGSEPMHATLFPAPAQQQHTAGLAITATCTADTALAHHQIPPHVQKQETATAPQHM